MEVKIIIILINFINTFHDILNKEDYNECNINMEILLKWLKCDKNHLKSTLINGYINNIDYILNTSNLHNGVQGGHNKIDIYINLRSFKLLIMRSPKGNEIRRHYILYEELLHKYKNNIIINNIIL